jgi:hypothetical protein
VNDDLLVLAKFGQKIYKPFVYRFYICSHTIDYILLKDYSTIHKSRITSHNFIQTTKMNYLPSNPLAKKSPEPGKEPTEEQKHAQYDALSPDQKSKQTYTEWVKEVYNNQYEKWMPWIEDQYLYWFGKGDNKASYVTKGMCLSTSFVFSLLSSPLSPSSLLSTYTTSDPAIIFLYPLQTS